MTVKREGGQAVVEFALISLVLMMLTVGLVDLGRGFFQYQAVASAARFGARWGSVVGGTCAMLNQQSTNDWCNQLNHSAGAFWDQPGNKPLQDPLPLQLPRKPCPSYADNPEDYYTVSDYTANTSTTIVGMIAQKYDTSAASSSFVGGKVTPGLDLTQLHICVELPSSSARPQPGETVGVAVYYPFTGVTTMITRQTLYLNATSQYQVE